MWIPVTLLIASAALDIAACYCIKRSKGFKKRAWGLIGLASISMAFVLLSFVVRDIPLGIAYSAWGSLGVLGTVLLDRYFFNSRLGKRGFYGIGLIISGIVLLQI